MPLVKGKGQTTGVWEELIKRFENVAKMMRDRGEQSSSLSAVLEASFDALSETKQDELLRMAVLPAGVAAPIDMLLNLWETKVRCSVSSTAVVGSTCLDELAC